MKRTFLALFLTCVVTQAATISFSSLVGTGNQSDEWIVTSTGGVALSSGIVSAGYFNTLSGSGITSASYAALVADFTALTSDDFVQYSSSISSNSQPIAGVTGDFVDLGTYSGSNRTLYVLVGNGSTFGNSTQFALLNSNQTLIADSSSPDTNDFFFRDTTVLKGTVGTGSFNGSTVGLSNPQSATTLQLVAVPEPAAALLGAVGMVGLLRRRRTA